MRRSLDVRKKKLGREKGKLRWGCVRTFAYNFRGHLLRFFENSAENVVRALNWKSLDISDRRAHITEMFRHSIGFRGNGGAKLEFRRSVGDNENALGGTSKNGIIIAEKALISDDYEQIVEVVHHEATHKFQMDGDSPALDGESVENCVENYVSPDESATEYLENPIEQEAFEVGRAIRRGLLRELTGRVRGKMREAA